MNAPSRVPLLLAAAFLTVNSLAAPAGKMVVLGKNQSLRPGLLVREKREIRVDGGRSKQITPKETSDVTTRYVQRINFVRQVVGNDTEEVNAREFLCEFIHFMGPTPPPGEQSSTLMSKTFRARRSAGRWTYDLAQGKPTPDERQTLDNLAYTAGLLDVLSLCIGTGGHRPEDTWKPELPAPRGKAAGYVVSKDVQCTFTALEDRPDGPHVTIAITGTLILERPMNYNAHVEITFEAVVVRRLTDMLDVDTKIKGTCTLKGDANLIGVGKAQLDFNYPYTLTRTLKIETK